MITSDPRIQTEPLTRARQQQGKPARQSGGAGGGNAHNHWFLKERFREFTGSGCETVVLVAGASTAPLIETNCFQSALDGSGVPMPAAASRSASWEDEPGREGGGASKLPRMTMFRTVSVNVEDELSASPQIETRCTSASGLKPHPECTPPRGA